MAHLPVVGASLLPWYQAQTTEITIDYYASS